ncbi:Vid22p NDAI_0J02050 [Naumovozyma dairenensis CBS 421]|uniref:BED-type domain-containing protein n=1 Tax=Naumovozyma dairenensis (strain ATCC 10597 / BCRC 20456 / CBS 421 / NBRC 0211 / NRRL Y-12639) TaxID=1071378 RepID=G0WH19_NAUDC|nr:hypothetical protein NDAI_0J02050 [Naumovozyma dairenensis CBS 421]CCD27097.1 hypothetical protein NDAI_0J02050 [Naumovozyma dairenensis CBS 421]
MNNHNNNNNLHGDNQQINNARGLVLPPMHHMNGAQSPLFGNPNQQQQRVSTNTATHSTTHSHLDNSLNVQVHDAATPPVPTPINTAFYANAQNTPSIGSLLGQPRYPMVPSHPSNTTNVVSSSISHQMTSSVHTHVNQMDTLDQNNYNHMNINMDIMNDHHHHHSSNTNASHNNDATIRDADLESDDDYNDEDDDDDDEEEEEEEEEVEEYGEEAHTSTTKNKKKNNKKKKDAAAASAAQEPLDERDKVDPKTEMVHDGEHTWVPFHLVSKLKSFTWTHFLAIDENMVKLKCKHCGSVLTKPTNGKEKSSTKKFRNHLRNKDRIDPTVSFYAEKGAASLPPKVRKPYTKHPRDDSNRRSTPKRAKKNAQKTANLTRPSYKQGGPTTGDEEFNDAMGSSLSEFIQGERNETEAATNEYVHTLTMRASKNNRKISKIISTNPFDPLRMASERQLNFPTNQLLSIIIASENLPLNFVENTSVKMLLSRIPGNYKPDQLLIKQSIINISNMIDQIIARTVGRNNTDLSLCLSTQNLNIDPSLQIVRNGGEEDDLYDSEIQSAMLQRLRSFLDSMSTVNFFSLSNYVWNNNISLLSLQFFDEVSSSMKILPLITTKSGQTNSDLSNISLRTQLNKAFRAIPGLPRSVLSITLPREKLLDNIHVNDQSFFQDEGFTNPKNFYHNCIVTILVDAIIPLFGTKKTSNQDTPNQRSNGFHNDHFSSSPLDSIVDISNVNIESSIFGKINQFYKDLYSNPWQLDRFKSLCRDHLNDPDIKLIPFDPSFYSTSEDSLRRFIQLRPVIKELDTNMSSEKFTEIDFQIMEYMLEALESINKLILYFASGFSSNFNYVLFSVLHVEKHLSSTLNSVQFQRLIKPFQAVLNNIQEIKKILLTDDMNLLAMFLCPAVLFEREILEYAFKSISLSDIVELVTDNVFKLLRRFINLEAVDSPNFFNVRELVGDDDDGEEEADDDDDTNDGIAQATRQQQQQQQEEEEEINSERKEELENILDNLLKKVIQDDLYEYLTTVNSIVPVSYKSYCEQSGYIRENGRFKKNLKVNATEDNEQENEAEKNKNQDQDQGPAQDIQSLNYVEELLDIHIPVCNAFWDQLLLNDAGVIIKILIKIMRTQAASSIRSEYSFLKNFEPKAGEDLYEQIVKIKLFNDQFVAGKVDFEMDTLSTASQYT